MNLIPAKELRAQLSKRKADSRQRNIDRQLSGIAEKIDQNRHAGYINSLTVMPEVEAALIEAGYVVKHHSACGMGDMDSITISW